MYNKKRTLIDIFCSSYNLSLRLFLSSARVENRIKVILTTFDNLINLIGIIILYLPELFFIGTLSEHLSVSVVYTFIKAKISVD